MAIKNIIRLHTAKRLLRTASNTLEEEQGLMDDAERNYWFMIEANLKSVVKILESRVEFERNPIRKSLNTQRSVKGVY